MKKINIGIIGCGAIFRLMHLPVLKKLEKRYNIISIFDTDKSAYQEIMKIIYKPLPRRKYSKIIANTDLAIFENPEIDAVFILTPISTHLHYTLKALTYNKHVFLEKPAALTMNEIDLMNNWSKKFRKLVQVGMVLRHSTWYIELNKIISSKKFGKVLWMHWLETRPFDPMIWRYDTKNKNGDAIINDKAVHQVNLFNSFAGTAAKKVFAAAGQYKLNKMKKNNLRAFKYEVPLSGDSCDHLMCIIEYKNGVKADLVISYVSEHARESRWIIQLEKAKIVAHFETFTENKRGNMFKFGTNSSCIYLFKDNMRYSVPWKIPMFYPPSKNNLVFYDEYKQDPLHPGSTKQLMDFYNNIIKNKKPECSLQVAGYDAAVIEAIAKSVKTKKIVYV